MNKEKQLVVISDKTRGIVEEVTIDLELLRRRLKYISRIVTTLDEVKEDEDSEGIRETLISSAFAAIADNLCDLISSSVRNPQYPANLTEPQRRKIRAQTPKIACVDVYERRSVQALLKGMDTYPQSDDPQSYNNMMDITDEVNRVATKSEEGSKRGGQKELTELERFMAETSDGDKNSVVDALVSRLKKSKKLRTAFEKRHKLPASLFVNKIRTKIKKKKETLEVKNENKPRATRKKTTKKESKTKRTVH